MISQIDAETLRDWLDTDHPVTVVDVRADEDRVESMCYVRWRSMAHRSQRRWATSACG